METHSQGSDTDIIATLVRPVPITAALKGCKDVADLAHLEQAISLLRQILNTSSESGTARLDVLNLLVVALLIRFNYDPRSGDMGEIIMLQAEIISLAQGLARGDSAATLQSSTISEHYQLAQSIVTSVRQCADVKLLDEAVSFQREALLMQPQGHERAMSLVALADALCLRFNHGKNVQDLAESIAVLREAHQLQHNHAFLLVAALLRRCNLDGDLRTFIEVGTMYKTACETDKSGIRDWESGQEQMANFRRLNDIPALHYAIRLFRQSIHHISFQHEQRPTVLFSLSKALFIRYSVDHNPDDLDQTIKIDRNILLCRPHRDEHRSYVLSHLGVALLYNFECAGDPDDIDNAIVLLDEALELISSEHHDRLVFLDNLAEAFSRRFGYRGSVQDIDKAVAMAELALQETTDGDSQRPHRLQMLGQCLSRRYEETGCAPDIEKAIGLVNDAVNLLPSGHPQEMKFRTELGSTYLRGFNRSIHRSNPTIDLAALNKSISDLQSFIANSDPGHPDIPYAKGTMAAMLLSKFEDIGDFSDITTAISLLVDTIRDTPDDDSYKPNHLHKLGRALTIRFHRRGQISDIDEAISVLQRAIQAWPYKLPDDHVFLLDLGAAFAERFSYLGVSADIDEAIAIQRRAVAASQQGNPQMANRVASLGCWLLSRFIQTKSVSDVDEAVATLQSALQMVDENDPVKPDILMNLATSLENQSECRREDPDIEKWIQLLSEAVRITSDGNPAKRGYLNNLGNSHLRRFEHLHSSTDIDEAISAYHSSLRLIPQDHPDHPATQLNLGKALSVQLDREPNLKALEATISQFSSAALSRYGPPRVRLQAASRWARYAWKYDHASVLQASAAALDLLPRVAWLGLPLPDRHRELIRAGDLMNAAAAICIERADYVKAVEWLEQGRSIVWGQLLQMRSPVDELRNADSDLAKHLASRFEQITRQLQTSGPGIISSHSDSSARYRILVSEWEDIIGEIRNIDGFHSFLLPKKLEEFVISQNMGPIVVLNISTFRCDALIVISHPFEVRHVPLSNFSYNDAQRLRKSLYDLLKFNGRNIIDDRLSGYQENERTHIDTDQEFDLRDWAVAKARQYS
ncbi:CHAT domain-containing protein [Mycena venus]|uniref:CHAT domain-containing protein n=1 Tax=Mycena venus TaxID=2733690 RepID=A0A8H7CP15_9AGAR|nr:CHAT domain-containing protein [Mycena venus]